MKKSRKKRGKTYGELELHKKELVKAQKEEKAEEKKEEEKYLSAKEILSWEKRHSQTNGKYIEALQASTSSRISGRILFNNVIASVC